ncbi:hypothetical protein HD806DRAFT_524992 [Xylariaceae sp. AK1471]|nr:hypothetical protein HD806DRAFT_524992 [Xylariaceae sp. AK1471]
MTISRRRESRLRLETLGHLSSYYSDAASVSDAVSIDNDDQTFWEADSNSSKASTVAVVFDKPPPPGLQMKKHTASESMRPNSSSSWSSSTSSFGEDGVAPNNSSLVKKPYSIQAETTQTQTFKTSQLKPAKGLSRPRHPTILRPGPNVKRAVGGFGGDDFHRTPEFPTAIHPGLNELYKTQSSYSGEQHPTTTPAISSRSMSEHGGDDIQTRLRHPSILRPGSAMPSTAMSDCGDESTSKRMSYNDYGPQKPSHSRPAPRGNNTSRPISIYSAYQPPTVKSCPRQRDHIIRASVSLNDTPNHSYEGNTSDDDDARSNYSTATPHLYKLGAQPTQQNGLPKANNQRTSQFQAYRPTSRATTRVEGVDFKMVSPTVVRTPAPAFTPEPMTSSGRGRPTSAASSTYSRSRSPSPAYGAWESDRPCQKRASFIDRAHERIERSINEHLMKAGRRPLPSFKVNRVEKSPTENVAIWEGKSLPVPPPSTQPLASRREHIRTAQGGDQETRPVATASGRDWQRPQRQKERRESWEISSGSEAEDETELFIAKQYQSRAPVLPAHASAPRAAATPITRRGTPKLRVDTSFRDIPGADRQALTLSGDDDSLLLGRGKSGMRHPASYSFFSSEYAQRKVAAQMERDHFTQQQQKQHPSTQPQQLSQAKLPRAQSSASLYRGEEEVEVGLPRTQSSVALSREQIGFAALPSPLEDLRQPFPFDDRRGLPSQTRHRIVSNPQGQHNGNAGRTLTRKRGMQLR